MGKGIVIFKGSTGFTQKYAQWIAEELNCDIVDWSNRKKIKFSDYETVIFGGRCYASSIDGLKWFKKHISLLSSYNLYFSLLRVSNLSTTNYTNSDYFFSMCFYNSPWLC